MKAMILAAGLGTRLGELTADKPKALVQIEGKTLLELLLNRFKSSGITDVIINLHHYADKIVDYLSQHDSFGMKLHFSREECLLDTGGAIKKAAWFFDDGQPFLVHNVDVLNDLNYTSMLEYHKKSQAIATLAVRSRKTQRYLLFDNTSTLCGWQSLKEDKRIVTRKPNGALQQLSFMGIHIISPDIFKHLHDTGAFSIITAYLQLTGDNLPIKGYSGQTSRWLDVGRPQNLKRATEVFPELMTS